MNALPSFSDPQHPLAIVCSAVLALDGAEYGGSIRSGTGGRFTCPVHADARPSLDIQPGRKVAVIANCKPCESVYTSFEFLHLLAEAIGVPRSVFSAKPTDTEIDWGEAAQSTSQGVKNDGEPFLLKEAHRYIYRLEDGTPTVAIVRLEDSLHTGLGKPYKTFYSEHLNARGDVDPGLGGHRRAPYLLQNFAKWRLTGEPIYLCEGEEAVKALRRADVPATTFHGGTSAPMDPEWTEWFKGFSEVIVWADRDAPGVALARKRIKALKAAKIPVRAVLSATEGEKDDAVEHLAARLSLDCVEDLLAAELPAVPATKASSQIGQIGTSSNDFEPGEFTDAALAERIPCELAEAGTPVAWNHGLGWLIWNGKLWQKSDVAGITEVVRQHVRAWFVRESQSLGLSDERRRALNRLQSRAKISAVVDLMDGYVRRDVEDFDHRGDLLTCPNGVVDLRTGELLPHDPKYGFTQITKAAYRPEARGRSKSWEKVKSALPAEVREYVLSRLGQAITGYIPPDDKVLFFVGGGENGKTTFLSPILAALGSFAGTVPQELLIANSNQHPEVFMRLRGLRLAWIDETAEAQLNPQRLKRVTGTTTINARELYKSGIEFTPTHALIVSTNHAPIIRDTDRGTWRRLEQVQFPFVYGGTAEKHGDNARPVDRRLRSGAMRKGPLEAVLADLVAHAMDWFDRATEMTEAPEEVVRATEVWRAESDLIRQFVSEFLEPDSGSFIPMSDLTQSYNDWLFRNGHQRVGHDRLTARLREHERLPDGIEFKTGRKRPSGRGASMHNGRSMPRNAVACWTDVRYRHNEI